MTRRCLERNLIWLERLKIFIAANHNRKFSRIRELEENGFLPIIVKSGAVLCGRIISPSINADFAVQVWIFANGRQLVASITKLSFFSRKSDISVLVSPCHDG